MWEEDGEAKAEQEGKRERNLEQDGRVGRVKERKNWKKISWRLNYTLKFSPKSFFSFLTFLRRKLHNIFNNGLTYEKKEDISGRTWLPVTSRPKVYSIICYKLGWGDNYFLETDTGHWFVSLCGARFDSPFKLCRLAPVTTLF